MSRTKVIDDGAVQQAIH